MRVQPSAIVALLWQQESYGRPLRQVKCHGEAQKCSIRSMNVFSNAYMQPAGNVLLSLQTVELDQYSSIQPSSLLRYHGF